MPQSTAQKEPIADLIALSARAEQELKGDVLPFWLTYTRNTDNGGFYGFIDADMVIRKDAARGGLLTCRILWTFSAAYRHYRDPAYLEMAIWAYKDLVTHFWDPEFGGLVWTISAEGGHKETNKLIYLQGFGIYALAEFYRATGDTRALARSIAIYELIEKHARDRASGGYHDALGRRWDRLGTAQHYLLGSARKSQNSHVHILEAYTNLLRVWADPNLRANQRELMGVLMNHVIDRRTYHSKLFLTEDWRPIGDRVSHGHDIELSWLLSEAADVLKDSRLIAEVKPIALNIASVTMAEGVDSDGGVINESGPNGYTDTDKNWWSQAEATVGFFNAYQISGDPRYFEASRRSWNYIEAKFVDRLHGDWIERVRRDGRPIRRPKVTLWKCPYHSSRSCLELLERAREQVGGAPAR